MATADGRRKPRSCFTSRDEPPLPLSPVVRRWRRFFFCSVRALTLHGRGGEGGSNADFNETSSGAFAEGVKKKESPDQRRWPRRKTIAAQLPPDKLNSN